MVIKDKRIIKETEKIMSLEIIKILDKPADSFFERHIFGLNIFHANKIDCSIQTNPQLEFLRQICAQNNVAVNIGNLFDYASSPEELFGNSEYSKKYYSVRIGCYSGEFYDSKEWGSFPPLLFPNVSSNFINILDFQESLILRIMYLDAMALFISPKNKDSENDLMSLLNTQITSTGNFVKNATDFYKLLMISQADGDYFTFFSQRAEDFDILNKSLEASIKLIEDSSWYQENRLNLHWDDEFSMCLIQKNP